MAWDVDTFSKEREPPSVPQKTSFKNRTLSNPKVKLFPTWDNQNTIHCLQDSQTSNTVYCGVLERWRKTSTCLSQDLYYLAQMRARTANRSDGPRSFPWRKLCSGAICIPPILQMLVPDPVQGSLHSRKSQQEHRLGGFYPEITTDTKSSLGQGPQTLSFSFL